MSEYMGRHLKVLNFLQSPVLVAFPSAVVLGGAGDEILTVVDDLVNFIDFLVRVLQQESLQRYHHVSMPGPL